MKKILSMLLVLALTFSMTSCGSKSDNNDDTATNDTTTNVEESATDGSVNDADDTVESEANSEAEKAEDTNKESNVEDDGLIRVKVNEKVKIDEVCEFCVESAKFKSDVLPKNPGSYYSHYEADQGMKYLDFCFSYKNLTQNGVGADEIITGKVLYDDSYEYSGFTTIEEDNRSDLTYSNITSIKPLTKEYMHYLFEVPEEVAKGDGSVKIEFYVGGNDYKFIVRR